MTKTADYSYTNNFLASGGHLDFILMVPIQDLVRVVADGQPT